MGDKVRRPQGWPHGQLRAAKKPQQEYGQGAAGIPQEHQGWVKRPQEWPQVRKGGHSCWPQRASRKIWAAPQTLEAKVSGVAKPPP